MMKAKIPLVLEPQPEGGYTVTSPLLPELITEGDTMAEALANVEDAFTRGCGDIPGQRPSTAADQDDHLSPLLSKIPVAFGVLRAPSRIKPLPLLTTDHCLLTTFPHSML